MGSIPQGTTTQNQLFNQKKAEDHGAFKVPPPPPPPPKATPAKKSALWKFRSFFWGGNQWVNNLLIGPYLLEGVLKKDWRGTFNFPSEDLGKPGLFFGKKNYTMALLLQVTPKNASFQVEVFSVFSVKQHLFFLRNLTRLRSKSHLLGQFIWKKCNIP